MEDPDRREEQVLLRSTDCYRFVVANTANTHDFYWLAVEFGGIFHGFWKKRKDDWTKAGGKSELGKLEPIVSAAVYECNKRHSSYPVKFEYKTGVYKIRHDKHLLGTVCTASQLTDHLLAQCVVLKANSKVCEYIRDSEGTIVRRFVYRAVDDYNKALACTHHAAGMFATGIDPATRKVNKQGKKRPVRKMSEHVMGKKPSIFLSFTTLEKGAANPHGELFGDVMVKIDLAELKTQGIPFTYLGSKEGQDLLLKEIRGEQGASGQAIIDVRRTREVLVEAWVPPQAFCCIIRNGCVAWSRKEPP